MSFTTGDSFKAACITVLGSGRLRPASGTWGSAAAVVLFLPFWWLGSEVVGARWFVEMALVVGILLSSALSVAFGEWAVAYFRGADPKDFVLDEFAGQWIAMLALPVALDGGLFLWLVALGGQFFLFRFFDIVKPPPARQLERLPAGWGILLDDLFAGAYANIVGQLIWRLTPLTSWLADLS